ncbi:hypothetical protein [Bacteroides zoogleoformans]|uniref:hypothetical protein n=1 Tax=Bacteroides zoogleoformans TaxID=28119 RepID=UPI00248EBDC0|nr:hypothetical protein [Bacteroides zoogleoformans]
MIIQIDDDAQLRKCQEINVYKGTKVYAYPSTIVLTPHNCKFLFFENKAKLLARQNCLDSKLNKWGEYFSFEVATPSPLSLDDIVKQVSCPITLKNDELLDENLHDRAKGFIFGYYLGLYKSTSPHVARMSAIQKRIYDITVAVKNNDGQSNALFNQELADLDNEYASFDSETKRAKSLWKERTKEFGIDENSLIKFLKKYDSEVDVKRKFCDKESIRTRKRFSEYKLWQLDEYSKEIRIHTEYLMEKETPKDMPSDELDVADDFSSVKLNKKDELSILFNRIVTDLLSPATMVTRDDLRLKPADIVTRIEQSARHILQENKKEWERSEERMFFYHLRENISNFKPFNLKEIDNIIWQSLAAFILKGNDFDELVRYLSTNSIPTYQYALALWGATCGYVQLSKGILEASLKEPVQKRLYKTAYSLLYKRKYEETLEAIPTPLPIVASSLEVRVKKIVERTKGHKPSADDEIFIKDALSHADNDAKKFIEAIGRSKMHKGRTLFKTLKKELYPEYNIKTDKRNDKKKDDSPTLFGDFKSIISDKEAVHYIESFLKGNSLKDKVVSLFKDFQKEYQPEGYYFNKPDKYKRNNSEVIEHFVKWCFSKKNELRIQWSKEASELMDKLEKNLLKIYHD